MANFLGEYEVALDAKGRFLLPSGLRKQMGEGGNMQFVIKRDFENCLTIYTMDTWNALTVRLNKLNELKQGVREFKRLFLNGANIVELDSADRMLVPKQLQEYAGIKKEAVLAAQGNKMELWDKDTFYKYISQNSVNMNRLAEEVANDNGNIFENL